MEIFSKAAGSLAVDPSGAVRDGVRKSFCSRVPEVRLVPSETTVTTSVARRGAVSARLTRTGFTEGQETGAGLADIPGVTPALGDAVPLRSGGAEAEPGVPGSVGEVASRSSGVLDSDAALVADGVSFPLEQPATARTRTRPIAPKPARARVMGEA